jgi:hypothetical protein
MRVQTGIENWYRRMRPKGARVQKEGTGSF